MTKQPRKKPKLWRVPDNGKLDTRYVRLRGKKSIRRYWIRPGHRVVSLPNDPTWVIVATQLNHEADAGKAAGRVVEKTVRWVIQTYRETDQFAALADASKRAYEPWLRDIDHRWANLHPRAIDREVFMTWLDGRKGHRATQNIMTAVMFNVLNIAHNRGLIVTNPAARAGVGKGKPRKSVWTHDERWAFLRAARHHPRGFALRLYCHLLYYTLQRPGDVAAMRWSQWEDGMIEVTQQKTGARIRIQVHRHLRWALTVAKRTAFDTTIVCQPNGRPYDRDTLGALAREVMQAGGIEGRMMRDLRRTGMVEMKRKDVSGEQITDVSGHSIEHGKKILDTYLPRDEASGKAAILKWEKAPGRKRPGNKM